MANAGYDVWILNSVWQITAPLALHYSPVDVFNNSEDINESISQVDGTSDLYIQEITNILFTASQ